MSQHLHRLGVPVFAALLVALCGSAVSAETRTVQRGQNLQTVLNAAVAGDVILLEAGAEFVGNFTLPVKTGDAPILVQSAAADTLPGDGVRITPAHASQLARIRSAFHDLLPMPGRRIQPAHAPLLARLRSPNTVPAVRTAAGAHHWQLRYLELAANQNGYGDIIQIGDGSSAQNTLARVPHTLVLSHVYVHGDRVVGQKRCIALNAANVSIRDSHVSDCKGVGNDTQAIGGWNGPGPYEIVNNYLEAAGETILFGGSDPSIPNLVPDGILVQSNHFSRPMAWREPMIGTPQAVVAEANGGGTLPAGLYAYRIVARRSVGQGTIGRSTASEEVSVSVGDGGSVRLTWQAVPDVSEYRVYGRTAGSESQYWTVNGTTFLDSGAAGSSGAVPASAGTVWSVKNIFELKNARNVVIERNILENHWKESQPGYAIVLTPRNSGGKCPWCVVEQVRFESNVVRHVAAGINVLGYDNGASAPSSQQANGILIRNNLFYDVSTSYGGNAWFLLIGDGPRDVLVDHNTVSHNGTAFAFLYGGKSADPVEMYNVRFTNNATRHNAYGVNGDYFGYGNGVINNFLPGATVTGNLLAGGTASRYPAGNRFSGTFDAEFVSPSTGDFRLKPGSTLRNAATDGGDIGADMGMVVSATVAVEEGLISLEPPLAPSNVRVLQ
jgi:hypothetical protein